MEKLIVKKRDNIACWKVDCDGVYPNTVLNLADGITLVIKQGGKRATLHFAASLFPVKNLSSSVERSRMTVARYTRSIQHPILNPSGVLPAEMR